MINKILMTITFICVCVTTRAQINLIRNGGFEYYTHCPTSLDQVTYAPPWNAIDTDLLSADSATYYGNCLPDYINGCSIYGATSEPTNGHFYQYPHKGKGMMQVCIYNDTIVGGHVEENNYLQGQLYAPLIAGHSYCVTFYTVMDNGSSFAINHIGAYFDNGTIDTTDQCTGWQTQYSPQILETAVVGDTLN